MDKFNLKKKLEKLLNKLSDLSQKIDIFYEETGESINCIEGSLDDILDELEK